MNNERANNEEPNATEPSPVALAQELERINTQQERPVTATAIRKTNAFSVRQYYDVFESLRSVFEATDINTTSNSAMRLSVSANFLAISHRELRWTDMDR
jgi:hypothetical protein